MKRNILILAVSLIGITCMQAQTTTQTSGVTGKTTVIGIGYKEFEKSYVLSKYNKWATRDPMEETTKEYYDRVKNQSKEQMELYRKEAKTRYLNSIKNHYKSKGVFESFNLGPEHFNADIEGGIFTVKFESFDPISFKVLRGSEAKNFLANWSSTTKIPTYDINSDGNLMLTKLEFKTPDGKSYSYDNKTPVIIPDIMDSYGDVVQTTTDGAIRDYLNDLKINDPKKARPGDFDVDEYSKIPVNNKSNNNTFVLIIANGNYRNQNLLSSAPNLKWAENDGRIFKQYCINTLKVPDSEHCIRLLVNATKNHMESGIEWLLGKAKTNPNANLIFFYSGHGLPPALGSDSQYSFLIPSDANGHDMKGLINMKMVCDPMQNYPNARLTVFIDACFSGYTRGEEEQQIVQGYRGVTAPQLVKPKGETVFFTACSVTETAGEYNVLKHGYFTYFLLKFLHEKKGKGTYAELGEYLKNNVSDVSSLRRRQTPQVIPAEGMGDAWKQWTFIQE
jgi:hypothetical protein